MKERMKQELLPQPLVVELALYSGDSDPAEKAVVFDSYTGPEHGPGWYIVEKRETAFDGIEWFTLSIGEIEEDDDNFLFRAPRPQAFRVAASKIRKTAGVSMYSDWLWPWPEPWIASLRQVFGREAVDAEVARILSLGKDDAERAARHNAERRALLEAGRIPVNRNPDGYRFSPPSQPVVL